MINCLVYHNNIFSSFDEHELSKNGKSLLPKDAIVWIDLLNPTIEEERLVLETLYPFHPLAIEDCKKKSDIEEGYHYPKVEEYSDYIFIIVNPLDFQFISSIKSPLEEQQQNYEFTTLQLNAFIGNSFLITHHYAPISSVSMCKEQITKFNKVMERGPDYIFHAIVDSMVDDFNPILEFFDDEIDALEEMLFEKYSPSLLSRIFKLKKGIVKLRKISTYQKEILNRLSRGDFALISEHERMYYRNVYDHLVRVSDLAESYRETVAGMLEAYISVNSNRMNQVMKVLTVISTIFLPLTFLSSIYGMNFHYMPELLMPYGYFMLWGILLSIAIIMLIFFKRKGWLE